MDTLTQHYGVAQGPLGFPLTDRQAFAVDALLKQLPRGDEFAYRKAVVPQATTELLAGERADVSWISTEDPDRAQEVVIARGLDDSQFALNPLVTMQHAYWLPPVGKSVWRKRVKDGERQGIKAKTRFPSRPASWGTEPWPPDVAFALVQSELLRGKSIGFLPIKVHAPTESERSRPGWGLVKLVIDQWLLLEYACCFLPTQPHAVVEAVAKAVGVPTAYRQALGLPDQRPLVFTPLAEYEKALARALGGIDLGHLAEHAVAAELERRSGCI
jgi:hypothetical protein